MAGKKSQPKEAEQKTKKGEERVVFEWIAPEYIEHERGRRWYQIAGGICVLAIIISVITANWTLALAIATFAGVYYYITEHHPAKNIKIVISELGIRVGTMFFPYSNIKAFWILYGHGVKTLNLSIAKRTLSDVVIQLNDEDPVPIRQYLVGQIPEWEGKHESLGDVILRLLKL